MSGRAAGADDADLQGKGWRVSAIGADIISALPRTNLTLLARNEWWIGVHL